MTLVAGVAAGLLVLGLPAAYFAFAYEYMRGSLDAQAEFSALHAKRLILTNPSMWVYEQVRLAEMLERRSSSHVPEARRILDTHGTIVAESADVLSPPVLARRHLIRDAGGLLAQVEVARSLRPVVVETGVALGLACLAAAMLFGVLRNLPLRALRRAHRSLAESERRYRSLYEAMREGLALQRVVREADGGIASLEVVDVNSACVGMLHLEREQLLGRDARTLLDGALAPALARLLDGAGGVPPPPIEISVPEHGRVLRVALYAPSEGHLALLLEDVTEARRLQEQLTHAQKIQAVGRLAGGVAHDFNNILTVILSCSGSLSGTLRGEELEQAREITKAGQRAAALTRQLLAFSRKQVVRPEILEVDELVRGLGRMVGRLIGAGIRLSIEVAEDVGCVRMDPSQFEQVLVNLAVNARDAMPNGGLLTIAARRAPAPGEGSPPGSCPSPGWVVIDVVDTGTGMDEETRSRVFEPFFTTKPPGKGTGLGLAMVFSAVRQGGGSIDVASAPGAGTTVSVRFPRVEVPEASRAATSPEAPRPARAGRVLLVDDEPTVRSAVSRLLVSGGHAVFEAASGEEALAAFRASEGGIDLVLTDLVMPGMSGLSLGRAVQAVRPVPVLYMSGYSETLVSGQESLAPDRYLQKPFERDVLLERVGAALAAGAASSRPSIAG